MIFLSWEALTFPSLSENRNYHSCPFLRMYSIQIKKHTHPSKRDECVDHPWFHPNSRSITHGDRLKDAVTQHDGIGYLISPIRLKGGKLLSLR